MNQALLPTLVITVNMVLNVVMTIQGNSSIQMVQLMNGGKLRSRTMAHTSCMVSEFKTETVHVKEFLMLLLQLMERVVEHFHPTSNAILIQIIGFKLNVILQFLIIQTMAQLKSR